MGRQDIKKRQEELKKKKRATSSAKKKKAVSKYEPQFYEKSHTNQDIDLHNHHGSNVLRPVAEQETAPIDLMKMSSRRTFVKIEQNEKTENETPREEEKDDGSFTYKEFAEYAQSESGVTDPDSARSNSYIEGTRTIKDCYAPDAISIIDDRTLKVGDKYVRNYVLQGYPMYAYVGWLDDLYSYPGNLDTMIYVEQQEARTASQELTKQITQIEAQRLHDEEKGNISNLSKYANEIARLEQERAKIESNVGSFFKVQVFANLFSDTKQQLDKDANALETQIAGRRMNLMPTALRMVDGYRSALPMMHAFYEDKYRNLNTGAVGACFPFYNAEICQPGGTLFGINYSTNTPMFINMYDKNAVVNTNMSVFGRAGSGKSYFTSLLIMRSALQDIHSAIIDPEGEYGQIATAMGGINIEISPQSKAKINVFDVEAAEEVDDDGNLTGQVWVDINGKVGDLVSLFAVMAKGEITQEQTSLVSTVVQDLYKNFGITEDPQSLYEEGGSFDPETGIYYNSGRRKKMPTLSDFHTLLTKTIAEKPKSYGPLVPFANQLRMFLKDGAYGLFDCQSTVNASNFSAYPVINFDVHRLEEGILRPVGMYIAMTYIWEKFVKKDFKIRKRVVCDEAWMLMNRGMAGSQYSRQFLEKCARRIRKRNAGLLVASQNFIEFANCDEGKSVLSNTAVRIFLKQSDTDIQAVKQEFNLSDGEVSFLTEAGLGEFLVKTDTESAIGRSMASKFEHELLTTKNRVQKI